MVEKQGKFLLVVVAAAALATSCVVGNRPFIAYGEDGYDPGYDQGPIVEVEPPAPQYEAIGVAPYPGYLWIGGVWNYEGGGYHWRPGHWEAPRHGYHWVPRQWHKTGKGWRAHGGRWGRD